MKNNELTESQKREIYFSAFGKQFDDPNRKQAPLPIDIAVIVALLVLDRK